VTGTAPPGPPPSGRRARLDSLTGLRFIAALTVFFDHAGLETVFRSHEADFLLTGLTASLAEAAVGFFFMLSGFVLTWSAAPGDTPRSFWRRRAAKILPNHVLTWTAGLVLLVVSGTAFRVADMIPSLFLVHSWIPSVPVIEGTDGPNWSLACEAVFYLSFPVLAPLVGRIPEGRLWRWAAGLGTAIMAVPFASLLLPYHPTLFGLPLPFYRFWFTIFLPPVRMLDFVLGIVLARIVLSGRWRPVRVRWIAVALLVAWPVSLALPVPFDFLLPFVFPLVLLLGTGAMADIGGRATLLSRRPMVWLGEVSYAFYLVHYLVLHFLHVALGGGTWGWPAALGFIAGALALSIAISAALYTLVERPVMRRWGRRALARTAPDQTAAARRAPDLAPGRPRGTASTAIRENRE
jgi:peptidoglycan/LPS O-acetylase OafA/YrhL